MNKNKLFINFFVIAEICFILSLVFMNQTKAQATVQKVRHSLKPIDLSQAPSTEELMAAGQLGGRLYPTEDIKIEDKKLQKERKSTTALISIKSKKSDLNKSINLSFGRAIQEWNKHNYRKAVNLFKQHIEDFPDSPWSSEAVLHMGCDARYNGRYREAEKHFGWVINKNKTSNHPGAKMLLNKARVRLGVLRVLQNNFKEAVKFFSKTKKESPDWRHRTYASHWINRISRYKSEELAMVNCGVQALAHLLEKDGKKSEASIRDTSNYHQRT